LALARLPEASGLDRASRIELTIVAAGARGDLGQAEAAVVALQIPELQGTPAGPWTARLQSAYADSLVAAGRPDEARAWLERAVAADVDGEAGAAERLVELDGVVMWEEAGTEEAGTEESATPGGAP
jgi:hypothetical protein